MQITRHKNKGSKIREFEEGGRVEDKKSPKPSIGEFLNPLSSPPGDENEGPTWSEFLNPFSPPPKRKKKSK